jgi:sarcosine oxidase
MSSSRSYDVAVVGAGVFGAWTAYHLAEAGKRVALVDAYGPGNSRSSSGGETRVIRCAYGASEIYTRWSARSLDQWKALFGGLSAPYFHQTGVLFLASAKSSETGASLATLTRVGIPHERLDRGELRRRFPQFNFGPVRWAILEPDSGVLLARRSVQLVVDAARAKGVDYIDGEVRRISESRAGGRLTRVDLGGKRAVVADQFVFACGPWLPKLFPKLLGERIFPTRQEVFYVGPPSGDGRFAPPAMPAWIDFGEEMYGVPDLERKGFKLAPDRHGRPFDPDLAERIVSAAGARTVRRYLARRFPSLARQPFVSSEVCQYENTSNGDFLIDRHPARANVWLVGGGSGHGFKHGPAVGQYVAEHVASGVAPEPLFTLTTKATRQRRAVY